MPNDLIQSVIRPASGAVLLMATTNDENVINPVIAMILGLGIAGGVRAAVKTVSRPAVTISTGGLGNPIVSMLEDGIAVIVSVLAILLPIIAARCSAADLVRESITSPGPTISGGHFCSSSARSSFPSSDSGKPPSRLW